MSASAVERKLQAPAFSGVEYIWSTSPDTSTMHPRARSIENIDLESFSDGKNNKMVKKAAKFTPEILIGSPRRSAGKPSPCGKYILHTTRSYDFDKHERVTEIRVLEPEKGFSHLIVGENLATEAHWLPSGEILYLRPDKDHGSICWCRTTVDAKEHDLIDSTDLKLQDLKLISLEDGSIGVLGWTSLDSDGNHVSFDEKKKPDAPPHTSRLYDNLMVRHWDSWKTKYHNALVFLQLIPRRETGGRSSWKLGSPRNVHEGLRLECPIPPFGGSDHYDISKYGITFVAKDPRLDPALHTTCDCYFVPITSKHGQYDVDKARCRKLQTRGFSGAASSPVFSPSGKSIAFLKMKPDMIEEDQNWIFFARDIVGEDVTTPSAQAVEVTRTEYDISPGSIRFGHDEKVIFLVAQFNGMDRLWSFDLDSKRLELLTRSGSVIDARPIHNPPRMFISGSSYVDDSFYAVLWPDSPHHPEVISSHSSNGRRYGLDAEQFTSFWYEGEETAVHALMALPTGFDFNDKNKKYPLAMLIHGGPQAAWMDQWSTRWNPAVWAAQGYVVIMPNITGSTGYGKSFCDRITNNWGGTPYLDIVKCMEHVGEHMPFVDTDRAVAAGASYGGFMMNWIQGHDLGRKFKALICHDGCFNNVSAQLASDEIYFAWNENGGPPWEQHGRADGWRKWDPSLYIHNWETPQLVIHNELDYRLTIAEGLGPFNVLQAKGIPSRLLVGKDENHWTLSEENSLVWHTVVLNWANKFVGLPPYKEDETSVIEPDEPFPRRAAEE